ncbi:MAG: mannonate dehydratase [Saprospiraceae bacterium]
MKPFQLEQLMRWYGPNDPVSLRDIAQSGCTGVVSALHAIPVGEVWPVEAIIHHKEIIAEAGLTWTVVESLPVHEEIKTRSGNFETYVATYKQSLHNLAQCGIKVITYNFMPVLDWVRTNVAHLLPNQSEALLFNRADYAAADLFMLKRPNAAADYTSGELEQYTAHFEAMEPRERERVFRNVLLGLPGSDIPFTPEQVLQLLEQYAHIDRATLKENLFLFLREISPIADELGLQLAIHPDDPPYSVLGLPRIMSTAADVDDLIQAVPNPSNGLCFCTGSFGARPDNDLTAMAKKYGSRIHFLHLRNTKRDEAGNFMEANHLEGDTDMYAIMCEVVRLMQSEQRSIPMRPDHGHKMLDDLSKTTYPGYSAIGRLKGLAELRGLEYGVLKAMR